MNENICIPKSYFFIAILIFIAFTFFHSYRMKDFLPKYNSDFNKVIVVKENKEKKIKKIDPEPTSTSDNEYDSPINSKESKKKEISVPKKIKYLNKRDKDSYYNDFKPPERRLPRNNYPEEPIIDDINIPTRGYPDNYHNLGMLVRKNDEKIFNLFGRQKFPGSNQWEYYLTGKDTYGSVSKIPLEIPGEKELSNNDTIPIPWLDQSKGNFEVKLFEYDVPRYNPYTF